MANQIQKIAVTGGPGSGKSTLCNRLIQKGFPVLDLDIFARRAVEKGSPAHAAISLEFGPSSLTKEGDLNRVWLREKLVEDPGARKHLETIIHPEVYRLLDAEISLYAEMGRSPVFVEFPLLFERKKEALFDLVVVVFVPYEIQVERVMARDGVTRKAAEGLINLQEPLSEKAERADIVFDNSGEPADLARQLEERIQTGKFFFPNGGM